MKKTSLITTILAIVMIVLLIIIATGCAQSEPIEQCLVGKTYGFFNGLWHGMIIFFSFIGSLFDDNIVIYAANHNGWYDLGFFIGVGALTGGSSQL